jgi:3-oxoacyl-[acyl-carrier protein] reductase
MVIPPAEQTDANRVAIVTGGSLGAGREITRHLAGQGLAVVVHYAVDQLTAEAVVEEVLAAHGVALTVRADVADELDVARLFTETIEAFGGVDVVAHAASRLTLGYDDSLCVPYAQQWTDMRSAFVVNQEASRQVRRGGAILNVCLVQLGPPTSATTAASNGGLEVMTRQFARELHEHDVTVNAVAYRPDDPGAPAVVAAIAGFLVSRDARRLTGQVIQVDGGVG